MTTLSRSSVGAFAAVLLASCGGSALEQSTFEHKGGYCVQSRCDGNTPGFWSNQNGCEALNADAQLLTELNAFLTEAGLPTVTLADDCAALDELLKVDAVDMRQKLVAMFVAFSLNSWNDLDEGCGLATRFQWDPRAWLPGGADKTCKGAVQGWFSTNLVEFTDLEGKALQLIADPEASSCEQETLKNFFDAVNNDAKVCVCECVTGATGGTGGYGGL